MPPLPSYALFDSIVAGWPHFGGCWFYLGLELDVGVAVIDLLRLFVLYLKLPSQRSGFTRPLFLAPFLICSSGNSVILGAKQARLGSDSNA